MRSLNVYGAQLRLLTWQHSLGVWCMLEYKPEPTFPRGMCSYRVQIHAAHFVRRKLKQWSISCSRVRYLSGCSTDAMGGWALSQLCIIIQESIFYNITMMVYWRRKHSSNRGLSGSQSYRLFGYKGMTLFSTTQF